MTIAAVLLAAGRSVRFGTSDKLCAPVHGLPLRLHAARTLGALDLDARFVVTSTDALDWPGYRVVINDDPAAGLSRSMKLGVAAARRDGATAVLIALADMPCVTAQDFAALLDHHRGGHTIVAATDGHRRMPPVLFGEDWFDRLDELDGDQGARALLHRADVVTMPADHLLDIDTQQDLASYLAIPK